MITQRTQEQPADRSGYLCQGMITTNEGVGLITVKGRDNSARITGITLTPHVADTAGTAYLCQVNEITYSASTRLTTISIYVQKLVHTAADNNVMSVTDVDIDVQYSFWVDEEESGLPADLSTNNTEEQVY